MSEQISKLLKDYLDELDDATLRDFQWYLGQYRDRGSRPIQRSQLENTSRTETVDKMVQAYGDEGAVLTTLDVLYRMRLNDLATRLAQGTSARGGFTSNNLSSPRDLVSASRGRLDVS